jgi:hypothetical protein
MVNRDSRVNPGSPTGSHLGPTGDSPLPPLPHPGPSEGHLPSPPRWPVNPDTLSSAYHQPPPPPQRPTGGSSLSPIPHPGPSEDHSSSPLGFLANPDTLSPTGHQQTPPQSPVVTRPPPSRDPSTDGFLDQLLKGKIKRRIYCELAPSVRRRGIQGQQIFQT